MFDKKYLCRKLPGLVCTLLGLEVLLPSLGRVLVEQVHLILYVLDPQLFQFRPDGLPPDEIPNWKEFRFSKPDMWK